MRGPASESYRLYMRGPRWAAKRKQKLAEVGAQCERCKSGERVEVHHRSYQNFGGRERMEELEVLCRVCHASEHGEDWDDALPIAAAPHAALLAGQAAARRAAEADVLFIAAMEKIAEAITRLEPHLSALGRKERDDVGYLRRRVARMRAALR